MALKLQHGLKKLSLGKEEFVDGFKLTASLKSDKDFMSRLEHAKEIGLIKDEK